ncbi:MAG: TonB-dependent receptor [Proteobacteria bacterium]|nr:TonB-dependent receptor [Pseudomonadota bacterium]
MLTVRLAVSAVLGLALASGSMAADLSAKVTAPQQSLSQALRNFSQRNGQQIMFTEDVVEGLTIASLRGELTDGADLRQLFEGTVLVAERSPTGTWMIRRRAGLPPVQTAPKTTPGFLKVAQRSAEPAAAAAPAAPAASADVAEEIVVTGSRVARDGFTAPTPTTIIGSEEIRSRAASNITEVLNEIPAFRASQTPAAAARGGSTNGGSFLDLRGLNGQGPTATPRTLVLVDGRRFTSSNAKGQVDLNLIPSSLIERTEVVTGGASAAWGSDAVAGVVNLILKDRLNGVEGSVTRGQSAQSDFNEVAVSLAAGTPFADGRGHIVFGAEYVDNEGVPDGYVTRDWGREAWGTVSLGTTRTAGLASRIVAQDVRISDRMAPGGIIVGGPLDNIEFLTNGQTTVFVPGSVVGGNQMVGGGAASNPGIYFTGGSNLVNPIERYALLTRANFRFNDYIESFVEASTGGTRFRGLSASRRDDASLSIKVDNAYLPAAVRQQMVTNKLTSITVGRIAFDDNYGFYTRNSDQTMERVVFGLKGELARGWSWNANYQRGQNKIWQRDQGTINSNYTAATDAVVNASGAIVCRGTVTTADPGCVPFNIFGRNSPSQAAVDYVRRAGVNDQTTTTSVAAANITGSPVTLWAGDLSLAAGLEYRSEKSVSVVDKDSELSRFDLGNYKPLNGEYSTREAYVEAVLPLLVDKPLVRKLELNTAARHTDYSTSGPVTTWKIGLGYEPNSQLKLRATQSRDIRAPNISELYSVAVSSRVSVTNPWTGQGGLQIDQFTSGNDALTPENADTLTAGVLYQPEWLEGLRASVDYYRIDLQNVISQFSSQLTVDRCYAGVASLCSNIVFGTGKTITSINNRQVNFNSLETSGVDLELSYNFDMGRVGLPGRLQMRGFGTFVNELTTTDPNGAINRIYQTVPKWSANGSLTYRVNRLSATAQLRYVGETKQDVELIGPDDPAYSPTLSNSININVRKPVSYVNLSGQYDLIESAGGTLQLFGVVNNLLDRDPPPFAGNNPTNASLYDLIGRTYKLGVRFGF